MHSGIALLLSLQLMIQSTVCFAPSASLVSFTSDTSAQETTTSLVTNSACAILMEASTGTIIYEKDAHTSLPPASVTKVMTLLLIFEALDSGKISLEDTVTVSEHAASMGGSQVYLEPGETQTVHDMIKCISISSANDASVAMAEFIGGSENAFVTMMNEKAKALGMKDTTFVNACGLDTEGHVTSAHDIALMSRELSVKHPKIHEYCTIWMDTITHVTAKGSSEFGLANTNKLLRYYPYATGLKTGFTTKAKYCLSATASKDGLNLIAVVMGADNPTIRNQDITSMLDYGFSKCQFYTDSNTDTLPSIPVKKSLQKEASISYKMPFQYLATKGENINGITKTLQLPDTINAPVKKGDTIGKAIYSLDNKNIGTVDIIVAEDISDAKYKDYVLVSVFRYFLGV